MTRIPQIYPLVQAFVRVFTKPSLDLFSNIIIGWILCPCRKFVTAIYQFGDLHRGHAHDAYHRFFRAGKWSLDKFFQSLAMLVVGLFGHPNVLWVFGDDTVHKKTGRKVAGAKSCRDAVRSTKNRTVYAWGLQIVLLCLEIIPPWGGEPLALPINMRLYRKRPSKTTGKSLLDLMREMLVDVGTWFPERKIIFVGDGFYAPLAGNLPVGVELVSRIRHDAALYRLPPKPRPGQRGRPRKRGDRLPTPSEMAKTARKWKVVETVERGKIKARLVHVRRVVWHAVLPGKYIQLVISRDPAGKEKDDFFISTSLMLDPALVISRYADRWAIEDTFRNVKQFLGIEQPQSWKGSGPENVAAVGYALYSLIWTWFLREGNATDFPERPWYKTKERPSFADALTGFRRLIWDSRFSQTVPADLQLHKFTENIIECLSRAA